MTQYINDKGEVYNGRYVEVDGRKYISPSRAKLLKLGYKEVVEEETKPTIVDIYEPTIEERLAELKQQLQDISDEINKLEQKQ